LDSDSFYHFLSVLSAPGKFRNSLSIENKWPDSLVAWLARYLVLLVPQVTL
jgi:hypothetical protein